MRVSRKSKPTVIDRFDAIVKPEHLSEQDPENMGFNGYERTDFEGGGFRNRCCPTVLFMDGARGYHLRLALEGKEISKNTVSAGE